MTSTHDSWLNAQEGNDVQRAAIRAAREAGAEAERARLRAELRRNPAILLDPVAIAQLLADPPESSASIPSGRIDDGP